ncbi:MAG: hypothetical protein GQ583_07880 [Methyloprofundus sp.]|nr:hypothetical protein [Methyloprofundus sp.]
MNLIPTPKILLKTALLLASGAFSTISFAHSAGATTDADGSNANATILAAITCEDDGHGEPDGLFAQIKDLSEPVDGLLISIQLYKGIQAITDTDTVSGDADYSEGIQLNAGPGVYQILVNKTDVGPRTFDVIWHCMTEDHDHTGTGIILRQFQ